MISVIIPVYNAEKSIEKSLDSIKNQTWKGEFEIILVNDGSTDRSREIMEMYQQKNPDMNIKLIHQDNGGVSKARNVALRMAQGEYIALLDSDDEWMPEKTEKQIAYLENKNLDMDFLSTRRKNHQLLFPYKTKGEHFAQITFRKLLFRNEAQPSTVLFKRKLLKNTGFFDDQQKYAEDVNYWLKASLQNKMYILDEELVVAGGGKRTFGISGLSANLKEMEKGFQKNIKEMYLLKRINKIQFFLYFVFYKIKYMTRVTRNFYLKLQGK